MIVLLKTKNEIKDFKKLYGSVIFYLPQFSYAAWKGGKNNLKWRNSASEEKLKKF